MSDLTYAVYRVHRREGATTSITLYPNREPGELKEAIKSMLSETYTGNMLSCVVVTGPLSELMRSKDFQLLFQQPDLSQLPREDQDRIANSITVLLATNRPPDSANEEGVRNG